MRGLVNPSMWISPVRLCLSLCHYLSQHCCCLKAILSPGMASKHVSNGTASEAALGSVGQERHSFTECSFISVLTGQRFFSPYITKISINFLPSSAPPQNDKIKFPLCTKRPKKPRSLHFLFPPPSKAMKSSSLSPFSKA